MNLLLVESLECLLESNGAASARTGKLLNLVHELVDVARLRLFPHLPGGLHDLGCQSIDSDVNLADDPVLQIGVEVILDGAQVLLLRSQDQPVEGVGLE